MKIGNLLPYKIMTITRSENMSRIRSSNTKPEVRLRKALWADGLRYRLQYRIERILPDIVFVSAKVVIFIDGCQWHGCPEHYVRPRTRGEFWSKKLRENVERDIAQTELLRSKGWVVYRVWEHDVWENLSQTVDKIKVVIRTKDYGVNNGWRVIKVDIIDLDLDIEKRYLRQLDSPEKIQTIEKKRSTGKWKKKLK
jgi:DNA mismatch endonuclease (patch repair protein)